MKKLIIFDLDNTFYNYQSTHEEALNSVFNRQNQYDRKEFIKKYNASKKIVHKRLGNNPSKHSKLLYFKEMYQNFLNFEEILNYEYLYWESFTNFADISDKDLKFLKEFTII